MDWTTENLPEPCAASETEILPYSAQPGLDVKTPHSGTATEGTGRATDHRKKMIEERFPTGINGEGIWHQGGRIGSLGLDPTMAPVIVCGMPIWANPHIASTLMESVVGS